MMKTDTKTIVMMVMKQLKTFLNVQLLTQSGANIHYLVKHHKEFLRPGKIITQTLTEESKDWTYRKILQSVCLIID